MKENFFTKMLKWFAGFFQDQKGAASRKAAVLYICMFYLYRLIDGSMEGKVINETILLYLLFIILFCLGAISSEFFKNNPISTKSTTKTTEDITEVDNKEN